MATLSFIIDAQNRAGQAIKEVESQVKGLEGKVKDMQPVFQKMALVGTAAFAGITAASWKAIEAYGVQERYEIKLAHLLKQTTDATDEQVQALYDQASALQQVGVYGDEVTLSLMGQLATFELNSETIAAMTPAILDMIVAENGLNATTGDMISFGNAFGMAMEGNYAALTRRGFKLDENTKQIIENGTEAEKAAAITAYLTNTYGGLNEAMRETSQGGLQAMKNELGDLWESIGQALIPIIKDLTETLLPVLQKTVEWAKENPQLVKTIIIASGAIAGIIAVIGTLGLILPPIIAGIGAMGAVMAFILSPAGLVIAIIGALITAGVLLYQNWDKVVNGVKTMWQSLVGFFNDIFSSISRTFQNGINGLLRIMQPFINAFETVKSGASWIGSQAGGVLSGAGNFIGGLLGGGQFGIDNIPRTGMYMLHRGEQVVPAGSGTGGGITVNINGGYYLSDQVAEDLGDKIIDQLKRQMKI